MAQRHFVIAIILAAAGAIIVLADAASATNVPGQVITTDTTWTLAGSPYNITGTVTVRNDATLTVEAGVTVNLSPGYRIYVGDPYRGTASERPGHIVLDGTAASPVIVKGQPIEFDGWNGAAGQSSIRNATFQNSAGWAIESYTFSPLDIHDSTFLNPVSGGIYLSAASPVIADTTFTGGPYGVYGTDWQSKPSLWGNTFANQTARWARAGVGARFEGNTYTGTGTAVELYSGNRWNDADITLHADAVTFRLFQWLGIRNGATLTIEPGFNALANDDFYFYVGDPWSGTASVRPATVLAEGTEAQPIVIGSISGTGATGWDGFQLNGWNGAARESAIRNATLRHAQTQMVYSNQWNNVTIDNVRFENGSYAGVYLESALPLIKDSDFYGSAYGVYATSWAARPTIMGSTFWNQTTRYARLGVEATLLDNTFSGPGTAVDLIAGNRWYDNDITLRSEPVTYHLYNWLGLESDATLTIEPGVNALGADDFYFYVGNPWSGTPSLRPAAVQALGTAAEPIVIGSLSGSPSTGWDGFQFNGWNAAARASVLRNVTLRQGQGQDIYTHTWNSLTLDNVTIENGSSYGMYLESTSPTVRGSTFRGSPYGIYSSNWVSRPTIIDSRFENQTTRHARIGLTSHLEGNTFAGTGTAVELLGGNRWVDETDVTIREEGVTYDLYNWIGLRNNRTLIVEPGVNIRSASDVTIYIGDPGNQATTGVRGAYGVYSMNNTAFAFHPGSSGSGCNTNGPDLRGYVCESIPYGFTNISTTGTLLTICDNCVTGAIPIGFNFTFYGATYSNAYVAENGFLTFSAGQSGGCCNGQSLPAYGSPDNLIAAFWDDPRLIQGGNVRYQTVGVAPDRAFIVQWTAIPHCCDNDEVVTFQIVLREGTNVAEVHLERAIQDGSAHVTGVESAALPEPPRGHVKIEGTLAQPVTFTSLSGSTTSGWVGFRFQGANGAQTSDTVLRNVTLRLSRGANAYFDSWSAGTWDNVTFGGSVSPSLYLTASSPTFRNANLNGSSSHNVFVSAGSFPRFYGGVNERSAAYGVYVNEAGSDVLLRDVELRSNARPLRVPLHSDIGGTIFTSNAAQEIDYLARDYTTNVTLRPYYDSITNARLSSILLQTFTVHGGATLHVEPDVRMLVENTISISIGGCCSNPSSRGDLRALGNETHPIYMGSRSGSSTNGWYGLYFRGGAWGGTSELRNVTLAFSRDSNLETYDYDALTLDNVTTERSAQQGLIFYYSTPTLRNVRALYPAWEAYYAYDSSVVWRGGLVDHSGRSGFYSSGCGVGILDDVVVESPNGYGYYADGNCNGAHFDGLEIRNATNRAWRNRLDVRTEVTITNPGVNEVEYWGNDVLSSRTLSVFYDTLDGTRMTTALLSSFTVSNNATWTLEPNLTILVGDGVSVNIGTCCSALNSRGNLTALATADEPIYIGSRSGSATNGWYGLYFRGGAWGGTSVLRNVTLAYSRDANLETHDYDALTLDNVTLDRSAQQAMIFYYSTPTLRNVDALNPGWEGMYFYESSPVWRGGLINASGRSGIYSAGCGVATLDELVIERATGYGFYADGNCNGAHFDGVEFRNATGRPWRNRLDVRTDATITNPGIDEVEHWGNDITSDRTLSVFYDTLDGTRMTTALLSSFTVSNAATWTISPDVRLLVNDGQYFNVGTCCSNPSSRGNLSIPGTAEQPVYIGSRTGSAATGWYGIYFRGDYAGGTSILRNATIALSRDEGIETYYYSGLVLDNVTLDRNARWGLHVNGGTANVIEPRIKGSGSHGVFIQSSANPTLRGGIIENSGGYGVYGNSGSDGAQILGTAIRNSTQRAFRIRITDTHQGALQNNTIREVEYWGVDMSSDRTLTPLYDQGDGARYTSVLLSAFTVSNQARWTIAPDVRLLVNDGAYFNIGSCCSNPSSRGELYVPGTVEEPVYVGSRTGSAATGWYGLYFRGDYGGGSSILRNATIAFSRDDGIETYAYNGLVLDNVTLDRNARYGLQLQNGGGTLRNVVSNASGSYGAYFSSSSPTWNGGTIRASGASGAFSTGCGVATLNNVTIQNSNGYGWYSDGNCNGAHFDGVQLVNNTGRPWRNRLDVRFDVTVTNPGVNEVEYWGNDLTSNRTLSSFYDVADGQRMTSVFLGSFTVYNQARLTVTSDVRLLVENAVSVNVGSCCSNPSSRGELVVQGTEAEPVYVGSRSGTSSTGWYGLYFRGDYGGGSSILRNATIAFSRDEGIETYAYNGLVLDNVTLDRNARYGLQLQNGGGTLRNVVSNGSGSYGAHFSSSSPTWNGGGVRGSGASGIYTAGCGTATLTDITVENANGYGFYADGNCNGANMLRVHFANTTGRVLRNRLDSSMRNVTTFNPGIAEVELWAQTIGGARTLTLEPVLRSDTGNAIPTVILGTFTVNGGAVLDLAPGLELRFRANEYVNVGSGSSSRGALQARGTKERPINISGVSTAIAGWGTTTTGGLEYEWASPSTLANTTIDGAQLHAVRILNDAQVRLDNVTAKRSSGSGLVIGSGATMTLESTNVTRNGARGIYVDGALVMRRSNVSENGHNGVELITAAATIEDSILYNNTLSGVNVTSGNPSLTLTRSYLWKNRNYGVDLGGTTGSTIVDNAFIENVQGQARATAANRWNVTPVAGRNIAYGPYLGGNSWSDYPGEDTDGNGLGDTLVPYANGIVGGDFHPVMGNLYADFTVEILDIVGDPLTLVFRDASRGGFSTTDQWIWDLGDTSQFVTQNVTHTYAGEGSFSVQLTVANPHGQVSTIIKTVHVDATKPITTAWVNGTLGQEGWHVSAVNVTLNATDDRSGVNKTFYRLDGGNLTTYTAKISVTSNGLHNLTYYSVDKNGNVEIAKNVLFQIDRTVPVALNATVNGTLGRAGWRVSDVTVLLNATDNVSGVDRLEYGVDAAPTTAYVDGVPLTTDGIFLVRYRAFDNAGLVSAEKNVSVKRDATLPEINATQEGLLGGGSFWLGPVLINTSAADAMSGLAYLNYSLDGGNETPVNGTIVVSGHGVHYVNISATDVAGNVNATMRLILQIDLSAPVSEHHFDGVLGANGIYVSPVNVTFTGNDTMSGIDHYVYSLDGGANLTYAGAFNVSIDGQHMLRYYAVDLAGNVEALHEIVVFLDLAAPTTNLNITATPGLNGWWLSNATGELVVDDPASLDRILYALDGGEEITYLSPFAIDGEGVHNVSFHSVSLGGLVEENQSRAVRVDLAAPTLGHAVAGAEGLAGWHVSPVSVALTPTDAASGIATTKLGIDGAEPTTYTGPRTVSTTGVHTLAANTTDVAGRVTDLANVSFQLDVDDPITTLALSPAMPDGAGGWYVTAPSVTLSATDIGAGVDRIMLSIDGAPETLVTGAVTLPEGVHTLVYRAFDVAGRAEALRNATVKVDLTAPTLDEVLAGTAGEAGWFTSPVNATLSPTDATSGVTQTFASVDGAPETVVSGPIALAHTRTHTIAWRALDAAGLNASEVLTVKVDRYAPTTTPSITPSANGFGWRNQVANVTLTATDQPGFGSGVAAIEKGMDGEGLAPYTSAFAVGEGFHNLSFRGIDVAGLVNTTTTQPIKVDLTPPTLDVTYRPADRLDGWHMASLPVNITATDALSGVRLIEYWIDNGGVSSTTGRVITLTTEGTHVLHVRARDFADVLSAPIDVPFKLDLNAPASTHVLAGTFGGNNRTVAWYRTPVNFTMNSVDTGAGVASKLYRIDAGADEAYTGVVTFAQERSYNLTYFATDLVDRIETLRSTPRFGVDLSPPQIVPIVEGSLDPEDGVYKTVVNVSLAADDALSGVAAGALKYRLDGGAFQTYAGTLRFNVSGSYLLEFYATDVAGNAAPIQPLAFSIFVDTTPPVTTLAPQPGGWFGAPVSVRLSAIDAQSSVHAILTGLDGETPVPTLGNVSFVNLTTEGVHTLTYGALDIAGNGELFRDAVYNVDLTPPTLEVARNATEGQQNWTLSPVVFTPTATDALSGVARVTARVNGVEQTLNGTLTLAQSGFYNVTIVAFDVAGLPSAPFNWSGKLDLDLPRPNVVTVGPEGLAGWFRNNVTVLLTGTDTPSGVSLIEYRWDNGTWATYPGTPFQFVDEGVHWLDVRVRDLAGNLGLAGRVVGLDHTAPAITTDLDGVEGEAGWWVSTVTATTSVEDLPGSPGIAVSGVHNLTRRIDDGVNESAGIPSAHVFNTSGVHTLAAFALDVALNGAAQALTIPVDLDDPALVTSLTGEQAIPASGWYTGNVTLEAVSTDPTSGPAAPLLDGAPMLEPLVLTTDGIHELALHARDVAGRLGSEVALPVKIDQTAPEPISNVSGLAGANGWFNGDATVTLSMIDATSGPGLIRFRVDNGTLQTYAGPFTLTGDGVHVVEWLALDVAGNLAERNFTVGIDTELPQAVANATGERGLGTWWRSSVNVTLNATDLTSGVAAIEYSLDGGAWTPYLGEPITISTEGRHTLEYRAIDGSGLPSIVYSHEILIDVTTPVVDVHIENTLYLEYDGVIYINGKLCVEVTGLDLLSGLNSLFLKLKAAVEQIIVIELDVGLTCFELPGDGGGDGGGGCEVCAIAADLAGNEEETCFDAMNDPGAPYVSIVRPFPGALNLQNSTIPLFKTAFAQGATVDTPGIKIEQETPDGKITVGERTNVAVRNQTLAETTLVAGTRVPVWVAAADARSPITKVELMVDDKLVGVANRTQNVTFQYVITHPTDEGRFGEEPTLHVPPEPASNETDDRNEHDVRVVNVTMPVYVFEIDTLALPSGDHNLTARAFDVPGNLAKLTKLVGYVSPAVGNATVDLIEDALVDRTSVKGESPHELEDAFPLGTWDSVPDQDIPAVPDPIRERAQTFLTAARIAAQLYDFLVVDNYAFVDRTVIDFFDAYETADDALASLPQPAPNTHVTGIIPWVRLVDSAQIAELVPDELPVEPPAIPPGDEEGDA